MIFTVIRSAGCVWLCREQCRCGRAWRNPCCAQVAAGHWGFLQITPMCTP